MICAAVWYMAVLCWLIADAFVTRDGAASLASRNYHSRRHFSFQEESPPVAGLRAAHDVLGDVPAEKRVEALRSCASRVWNMSRSASSGISNVFCARTPARGSDPMPIVEPRRLRLRWYMLPSNPIHVCSGVGVLVQTMQRNVKFTCDVNDVYTPEVRRTIQEEIMPNVSAWLQQTLLLPPEEVFPNGTRSRSLFVDRDLGLCEGQLTGFLPRSHRSTFRMRGPVEPQHVYDQPLGSVVSQVLLNTSASRATPSAGRGAASQESIEALDDVDLVIYVTSMFSYYYMDAMPCQFHPTTGRPTVVHVNIDPALLSANVVPAGSSSYLRTQMVIRHLVRDVVQSLAIQNFYHDLDPTQYTAWDSSTAGGPPRQQRRQSEVLRVYRRPEALTTSQLIRQPIVAITQARLQCTSVAGADLENVGEFQYTIVNNILSGRMFSFDTMTYDQINVLITDTLYGLLATSEWWEVDWSLPLREANPFGLGAGCTFASDLCNNTAHRLLPPGAVWTSAIRDTVTVSSATAAEFRFLNENGDVNASAVGQWVGPQSALSNASLLFNSFCFNGSERQCHVEQRGAATCGVYRYNTGLPTAMQYFSSPNQGGGYLRTDYCPIYDVSYVSCAEQVAAQYGSDVVVSPYDDLYCLDRVLSTPVTVSWFDEQRGANRSTEWWVGRKNGTGCFRVTECDSPTHSFVVRSAGAVLNGIVQWEAAHVCGQSADVRINETWPQVEIFDTASGLFVCPQFDVVCAAPFQRYWNVLPRDGDAAAAAPDTLQLPPLAWQAFSEVTVMLNDAAFSPSVCDATSWIEVGSTDAEVTAALECATARGWRAVCNTTTEPYAAVMEVPLRIAVTLPRAGAVPLGGVLVAVIPRESGVSCAASDSDSDEAVLLFPSRDVSNRTWLLQHAADDTHEVVAFAVGADEPVLLTVTTETIVCRATLKQPWGDGFTFARLLELSLYALHPTSPVFNVTSGAYQTPGALVDAFRNGAGSLEHILSPLRVSSCGLPSVYDSAFPTNAPPLNTSLDWVRVATAFHVFSPSAAVSPLLALNWASRLRQSQPFGACADHFAAALNNVTRVDGGIDVVLSSVFQNATSVSLGILDVNVHVSDSGIGSPNATLVVSLEAPDSDAAQLLTPQAVAVVSLSVEAEELSAVAAANSTASVYALQYLGDVAQLASLMPVPLLADIAATWNMSALRNGGCETNATANAAIVRQTLAYANVLRRQFTAPYPSTRLLLPNASGLCREAPSSAFQTHTGLNVDVVLVENWHSALAAGCTPLAYVLPSMVVSLSSGSASLQCTSLSFSIPGFGYTSAVPNPGSPVLARLRVDVAHVTNAASSASPSTPLAMRVTSRTLLKVPQTPLMLFPSATTPAAVSLQVTQAPNCAGCLASSLYVEFRPRMLLDAASGAVVLPPFTEIVLKMNDMSYRRDQMWRHPWLNVSSGVSFLSCSNTSLAVVSEWRGEQFWIRTGSACYAARGVVGLLVSGFVAPSSASPTGEPIIADFRVVVSSATTDRFWETATTMVGIRPAHDAWVSTACAQCNYRGLCAAEGCRCFAGYGGASCDVCSAELQSSNGGNCKNFCSRDTVIPGIPPRFVLWRAECLALPGGWLNPQDSCRCYCNGTRCLDITPTTSLTISRTLAVPVTPSSAPTSAVPSASSSASPQVHTVTSPPLETSTHTSSPQQTSTMSPTPTGSSGSSSPSYTSTASTATPTGPSHSSTDHPTNTGAPSGSASPPHTASAAPSGTPQTTTPTASQPSSGSYSPQPTSSLTSTSTVPPSNTVLPLTPSSTPFWPSFTPTAAPSADPSGTQSTTSSPELTSSPTGTGFPSSTPSSSQDTTESSVPGTTPSSTLVTNTVPPESTASGQPSPTGTSSPTPTPSSRNRTRSVSRSLSSTRVAAATPTPTPSPPAQETLIIVPEPIRLHVGGGNAFDVGDVPLMLSVLSPSPMFLVVYGEGAVRSRWRRLLQEVSSPLTVHRVLGWSINSHLISFEPPTAMESPQLLTPVLIPVARLRPPRCASVPSSPWNASWNATLGNASTAGANATRSNLTTFENTEFYRVPGEDVKYLVDLMGYGPVFRDLCFGNIELHEESKVVFDEVTQTFFIAFGTAPKCESQPRSKLRLLSQFHAGVWGFLAVLLWIVSPQLVLDAQLMVLLNAAAPSTAHGCRGECATTIGAVLFSPAVLEWAITPCSLIPQTDDYEKDHATAMLRSLATHVGFAVAAALVCTAVIKLWCASRYSWSTSVSAVIQHSVVALTGVAFQTGGAMRAVAELAARSPWMPTSMHVLGMAAAVVALLVAAGTALYHYWVAVRVVDAVIDAPYAFAYRPFDSLRWSRLQTDTERKSVKAQLQRGAPKTLFWSKRLLRWVAVWLPPQRFMPRGYWKIEEEDADTTSIDLGNPTRGVSSGIATVPFVTPLHSDCDATCGNALKKKRQLLCFLAPLVKLLRNLIVAFVTGLGGHVAVCDALADLCTRWESPVLPLHTSLGFACVVVVGVAAYVGFLQPYRSYAQMGFSGFVSVSFVVHVALLLTQGDLPYGGRWSAADNEWLSSMSSHGPLSQSVLVVIVLAADALALCLGVYVWFESNIMDGYFVEAEAAIGALRGHRNALDESLVPRCLDTALPSEHRSCNEEPMFSEVSIVLDEPSPMELLRAHIAKTSAARSSQGEKTERKEKKWRPSRRHVDDDNDDAVLMATLDGPPEGEMPQRSPPVTGHLSNPLDEGRPTTSSKKSSQAPLKKSSQPPAPVRRQNPVQTSLLQEEALDELRALEVALGLRDEGL